MPRYPSLSRENQNIAKQERGKPYSANAMLRLVSVINHMLKRCLKPDKVKGYFCFQCLARFFIWNRFKNVKVKFSERFES